MAFSWVLLALGSAVFAGAKDIFAKKAFKKSHFKPNQVLFFEYFFLMVLTSVFFYFSISVTEYIDNFGMFLVKLVSIFGASIIFYELLKDHEVSTISPLRNASPVFLVILSALIFSEQTTIIQLLGIGLIIAATFYLEVIIQHHDHDSAHHAHKKKIKGHGFKFWILVLTMLILISFAAISDKIILAQTSLGTNLFFTAVMMVLVSTFYSIKDLHLVGTITSFTRKPELLIVGAASSISLILVLSAIAIPSAMVSLIIPIRRTSTIMAAIGGGLLFHEKHLEKKFSSVVVMLFGVILIVL